MASHAEASDAPDEGGHSSHASEPVSGQTHYNLRPRPGHSDVRDRNVEANAREPNTSSRQTVATTVIEGVDAKVSPVRDEIGSENERGRSPDRRTHDSLRQSRRASSGSSDAGSAFSSAPGSPVSVRGPRHPSPHTGATAGHTSVGVDRRRSRLQGDQLDARGKHHRHHSPPIFEDMSWAELEAYRKIHLAFQQQRLSEQTDRNRVHESAIRPNPSLLFDGRKEADPLRAQTMSKVCGPSVSRQPGRDAANASRVNRRVSDNGAQCGAQSGVDEGKEARSRRDLGKSTAQHGVDGRRHETRKERKRASSSRERAARRDHRDKSRRNRSASYETASEYDDHRQRRTSHRDPSRSPSTTRSGRGRKNSHERAKSRRHKNDRSSSSRDNYTSSDNSKGDRCGPRRGISPLPRRKRTDKEWSTTAACGESFSRSSSSASESDRRDKALADKRSRKTEKRGSREHKRRSPSTHVREARKASRHRREQARRGASSSRSSSPNESRRRADSRRSSRHRSHRDNVYAEKARRSPTPTTKRPHKQWFSVDRFDGSTPWRPFAERFNFCAKANGWNSAEKCAQLQACLKGMAAQILCYGKNKEWSYRELYAKLEDRFGSDDRSDEYLAKLETRRRGAKETLQQLCHSIEELVALAYPGPKTVHSDRFAITSFLRALNDAELSGKIRDKQPKTLDEAFRWAQMYDSFRAANAESGSYDEGRRGRDGHARAVAASGQDETGVVASKGAAATEKRLLSEIKALRDEVKTVQLRQVQNQPALVQSPPTFATPLAPSWALSQPAYAPPTNGPPQPAYPPPVAPPSQPIYSPPLSMPTPTAPPNSFYPGSANTYGVKAASTVPKNTSPYETPSREVREQLCFGCKQPGHWRRIALMPARPARTATPTNVQNITR